MKVNLTESFARTVKPTDVRVPYIDDGLILEVNPSGKKVFYYKFRQDGKQVKRKLGDYPTISVKEAKQLVLNAKHDVQIKGIKQPILGVTFKAFVEGEFKEWLFANNKSAQDSYKTIQTHFLPLLGHIKIKDIEPRIIERWKNQRLNAGISASTVTRNLTELRTIFSRVEDWYKLPTFMPSVKNPSITSEKEKLYLSADEMKKLREMCDRYTYLYYFGEPDDFPKDWGISTRSKVPIMLPYIIHIAINTGMRKGEILQLKFSDIDRESKMITVRGSTEKTKRYREIAISDKLDKQLSYWGNVLYGSDYDANSDELVFPIGDIKRSWETFRKRAGLEHVLFKTLRHHFASSLVLKNVALSTVMNLMGHTNIKTTQRYLSVRTEDKFEAVNLL
jgi:integrase